MIVIGTAGHIDHGKSAIVKRLTGTDPDRLPEEKKRGMTIDLGFAFHGTPGGDDIAFVDVPGHERFVRNMIAGAGGIDSVMLVVAADDGWMPQSREHFQITKLLGIKHGLIVINKIDLADPDWVDLVESDVRDKTSGSFLDGAPLFRVSAQTGEGFDELTAYLDEVPGEMQARKDIGKARLYVDRSFVRPGIGQVVTGTLRGGSLQLGQTVSVWPGRVKGKVRTLQSKGEAVETVSPGQRTSVSLTGVDREQMVRGGVLSDRLDLSYFVEHPVLALSMELLQESPISLADRRRVLLIVGSTEMDGEVRMVDHKEIRPGATGLVLFKPDEPVYSLVGDRFIIRLITPMVTLGGGMVLDHLAHLPRRKHLGRLEYLKERLTGQLQDILISELRKGILVKLDRLLQESDFSQSDVGALVEALVHDDVLGRFGDYVYHRDSLTAAVDRFKESLEKHLAEQPHLKGLTLENITRLSAEPEGGSRALLEYLLAEKIIVQQGDLYNLAGRGMSLKGVIKQAHDQMMEELTQSPYMPPTLSILAGRGKNHQAAIKYMIDSGEVYKCGADFLFLSSVWEEIISYIRQQLESEGELKVTDLREEFGFTRKWVIPIVEETDRLGLTARKGDIRVKGEKF